MDSVGSCASPKTRAPIGSCFAPALQLGRFRSHLNALHWILDIPCWILVIAFRSPFPVRFRNKSGIIDAKTQRRREYSIELSNPSFLRASAPPRLRVKTSSSLFVSIRADSWATLPPSIKICPRMKRIATNKSGFLNAEAHSRRECSI